MGLFRFAGVIDYDIVYLNVMLRTVCTKSKSLLWQGFPACLTAYDYFSSDFQPGRHPRPSTYTWVAFLSTNWSTTFISDVTHLLYDMLPVGDIMSCHKRWTAWYNTQIAATADTSKAKGLSGHSSCPTLHFFFRKRNQKQPWSLSSHERFGPVG